MRIGRLCVAALMLLAACGRKEGEAAAAPGGGTGAEFKASTPREFWDSYQSAVKRKDTAALAKNLYSKATAQKQAEDLRKGMPDLRGKGDEEVLVTFFGMWVSNPDEKEFVSAEEDGDRATIVFNRTRGGRTDSGMKMFLVREEGRWRQQ